MFGEAVNFTEVTLVKRPSNKSPARLHPKFGINQNASYERCSFGSRLVLQGRAFGSHSIAAVSLLNILDTHYEAAVKFCVSD